MAVADLFDRGLAYDPHRPFAIDPASSTSFAEAADLSHRIANALAAEGVGPGSSVAVYSPNSALGFTSVIGVFRSGAAWVPLNYRDGLASKIDFLRKTKTACVFYDPPFEDEVGEIAASVPTLRLLVALGPSKVSPVLREWVRDHAPAFRHAPFPSEQIAVLDGTGGTTGTPKAAMQSHRSIETMAANTLTAMPLGPESPICLIATPMTHGAGNLAHALMASGATNVLLPQFDPEEALAAVERYRVTHVFLPPTAIYMLLTHERIRQFDLSSLRYLVYGGAPMSVDKLKEAIEIFGPVLTQIYGQAEACLICTCLTPAGHVLNDPALEHHLWSCGRPALLTPVQIMDDAGHLLGTGNRGEIVVRGSLVMSGYFEDPQATAEVTTNGWHRTGDVGYVDDDGFVYIVDRKKEMIISGGFNVYPVEVERALLSHPAVRECAVVGAPDEKWGEAVTAVLELKPGAFAGEDELIAHCKKLLGSIKTPKRLEIWPELPRNANGKILKREIRARFWPGENRRMI